jgi:hypothetical protein
LLFPSFGIPTTISILLVVAHFLLYGYHTSSTYDLLRLDKARLFHGCYATHLKNHISYCSVILIQSVLRVKVS